jgi:hypothetical protein
LERIFSPNEKVSTGFGSSFVFGRGSSGAHHVPFVGNALIHLPGEFGAAAGGFACGVAGFALAAGALLAGAFELAAAWEFAGGFFGGMDFANLVARAVDFAPVVVVERVVIRVTVAAAAGSIVNAFDHNPSYPPQLT